MLFSGILCMRFIYGKVSILIRYKRSDCMATVVNKASKIDVQQLNEDIANFPQVHPITDDMNITNEGESRLVMLDRYAIKDTEKKTLRVVDFVVLTLKDDPNFPARGLGFIKFNDWTNQKADMQIEPEF